MKEIKLGQELVLEEEVTRDKSASQIGSGILDVYSTPAMIALMEKTSYLCVEDFLDSDESTVGGAVNIRHMKPTAIGKKVICTSKVLEVEKKRIEFEVIVKEDGVIIGKGHHTRFVVEKASFMKML